MGARADRVPAIVLGVGISALGALRVLTRARIPVVLADRGDPLLKRSRHYPARPVGVSDPDPRDLAGWLDALDMDRAVLIPCSDNWAMATASLDEAHRARFPASVPSPDTLVRFIDKNRFTETLVELGVPHPRSVAVSTREDLDRLPEDWFSSAFLKPRDSQRFHLAFGVKAFWTANRAEAVDRLAQITSKGLEVVLQEYIPGPVSNHYFIDGFRDRNGKVTALFARQRLRMYPPLFGNSTFMRSVPLEEARGAVDGLLRLFEGTRYRGIFSAEFKRDPGDGLFKILEVNTRVWWYVDFAARAGVDVCSMAYRDALGLEVGEVTSYRIGRTMVYPYNDYFACQQLRRSGDLSLSSWVRSWVGAEQPVFQWGDPWPAIKGATEVLAGRMSKLGVLGDPETEATLEGRVRTVRGDGLERASHAINEAFPEAASCVEYSGS